MKNCGCSLGCSAYMYNWREIPDLDSSSETNESVKLLKCIKFVEP